MKYIRYVIQMKNKNYMRQEWWKSLERVKIVSVENPIEANLFKSKDVADRILQEVLSGNTNLLTIYDDENPPEKVVKIEIEVNVV